MAKTKSAAPDLATEFRILRETMRRLTGGFSTMEAHVRKLVEAEGIDATEEKGKKDHPPFHNKPAAAATG